MRMATLKFSSLYHIKNINFLKMVLIVGDKKQLTFYVFFLITNEKEKNNGEPVEINPIIQRTR